MSWRTVYISSQSHLSYKNNFLVIRGEDTKQVHISEINTIIIDSNTSTISTYLLNELVNNKIKVIFCNQKHNPSMEMAPYNNSFESSRIVLAQTKWGESQCDELWQEIVKHKIRYQARVLKKINVETSCKLLEYAEEVEVGDASNREGHAAKVYFNSLFGTGFARDDDSNINSYLNYGYTILLSIFNRLIVSHGYITQIGIHHKGPTNPFNLSCDLMEPFRPIIDNYAIAHKDKEFDIDSKKELVKIINKQIRYMDKVYYLHNAIDMYVINTLSFFETGKLKKEWFEYEE